MNKPIKTNIPLHDKNWFKTGGNAQFYAQPKSTQELQQALSFAQTNNLPITLLGEGANVLINDEGIRGLVIHPSLKKITFDSQNQTVTVEAGVKIQNLIDNCLERNLLCMQEFSGIPGSIGGAVYMNIHYFTHFLSNHLLHAQVLNIQTNTSELVTNKWFEFGYDQSKLHKKTHILVNATFKITPATDLQIAYEKGKRDERIAQRNNRYPTSHTCGSFFRNFHEHELESGQLHYIAYYLDKLGIKGELLIGGAKVSHQHANMIVNIGTATSKDIIELARIIQQMVFNKFGLLPQSECQPLGFKKNPL